ncbi:hypothetical protein V8D89_012634 [Ganoderma adspersum]
MYKVLASGLLRQKAAWPGHESQCQDTIEWQNGDKIYVEKPTGGLLYRRARPRRLQGRHRIAAGGPAQGHQYINIRLRLSFATPATQWDRNPSTPFKFESSSDMPSPQYDRVVSAAHSWDSEATTTAPSNAFRKLQTRYGDEFAGPVPVLVTVDIDGVVAFARFDLFPGPPPDRKLEGKEKQIMDDARVLCKQSVNFGLLLGVSGMDQRYVYPGRFVQEQKRWEWRPLFEDWAVYDAYGRNAVIDAALGKFTSGLFVANVIANVQRL